MEVRQRLEHGPEAPGAAREALDAVLAARLDEGALAELRLVVSELVTNAVRHGAARDGSVDLAVSLGDGVARVDVIDGGDGFLPPTGPPDPEEPGGWGLIVVERLARRWGIDDEYGTHVWAEMPIAGDLGSGGAPSFAGLARNV